MALRLKSCTFATNGSPRTARQRRLCAPPAAGASPMETLLGARRLQVLDRCGTAQRSACGAPRRSARISAHRVGPVLLATPLPAGASRT